MNKYIFFFIIHVLSEWAKVTQHFYKTRLQYLDYEMACNENKHAIKNIVECNNFRQMCTCVAIRISKQLRARAMDVRSKYLLEERAFFVSTDYQYDTDYKTIFIEFAAIFPNSSIQLYIYYKYSNKYAIPVSPSLCCSREL